MQGDRLDRSAAGTSSGSQPPGIFKPPKSREELRKVRTHPTVQLLGLLLSVLASRHQGLPCTATQMKCFDHSLSYYASVQERVILRSICCCVVWQEREAAAGGAQPSAPTPQAAPAAQQARRQPAVSAQAAGVAANPLVAPAAAAARAAPKARVMPQSAHPAAAASMPKATSAAASAADPVAVHAKATIKPASTPKSASAEVCRVPRNHHQCSACQSTARGDCLVAHEYRSLEC